MKKGFTLIELLVVVLIIGILSAIALPQYQTAVDKARYSTMMAAVRALKDAEELYYLTNGKYTDNMEDLAGSLPAGCSIDGTKALCDEVTLFIGYAGDPTRVFGRISPLGNAYLMGLDRYDKDVYCYAYKESGERGLRLCKSLGGLQIATSINTDCDGGCTRYKLD